MAISLDRPNSAVANPACLLILNGLSVGSGASEFILFAMKILWAMFDRRNRPLTICAHAIRTPWRAVVRQLPDEGGSCEGGCTGK